ncbi:hypothetical protein IFM89_003252, partial [Coptis chinensis]
WQLYQRTFAHAKEFVVGDEKGWTIGFDYQAGPAGKNFQVGDTLGSEALTTGNDVIMLATPGRKWYICGVGKHWSIGAARAAGDGGATGSTDSRVGKLSIDDEEREGGGVNGMGMGEVGVGD